MTEKRILFIDSQPETRQGLKRLLRPHRHDWEMEFTGSGQEALEQFAIQPFQVVVSDSILPGISGVELMQRLTAEYPATIRIFLTGSTDPSVFTKLLPLVHMLLSKPCEPEQLVASINRAYQLQELLSADRINQLVARLSGLPPAPGTFAELQRVIAEPSSTSHDLAKVISRDPVLAAKILRIVNSAAVGMKRPITSIDMAVSLLGIEQVKAITLACDSASQFGGVKWPQGYDPDEEQRQAFQIANLAKKLMNDPKQREITYLAGLVHDIGKTALAARLPDEYESVTRWQSRENRPRCEIEKDLLGADHAELGGVLMNLWNLPTLLVEAVTFHHCPGKVPQPDGLSPAAAVFIAERCQEVVRGDAADRDRLSAALVAELGDHLEIESHLDDWLTRARHVLFPTQEAA